jgi:hypothetical protein
MSEWGVIRRRIRRVIRTGNVSANLAADVNAVVTHGKGGSASSRQRVTIRQGRADAPQETRPQQEGQEER